MRRHHPLPFGAELVGDGEACFRVWAPSATTVDLVLRGRRHRLAADPHGWCAHRGPAEAGDRYHYVLDGRLEVPDVAARALPEGVHGPALLTDPSAHAWKDEPWRGRPWSEMVLYELHVGTFSARGDFRGVVEHLDHLAQLGITGIELMPLAASPGARGWGYDGVAPFAPWATYGPPEDLKHLVEQAHLRGLAVILDVVYNHFGPEGCYFGSFARPAFDARRPTPWGDGLAFDRPFVRELFVENALYWLHEMHMDGLRIDAAEWVAHDLLLEMARQARARLPAERHVHLVLESVSLQDGLLAAEGGPRAQWSDEIHHPLHVIATGESTGVLKRHAHRPFERAARALATGSGFEATEAAAARLPRTAYVAYASNHDQVGNRARGDRILEETPERSSAVQALLLLCPCVPMLFMGEEWGARTPFGFFSDLEPRLREGVRRGRQDYLRGQPGFAAAQARRADDPFALETFTRSRLDWAESTRPAHAARLERVRSHLEARRRHLTPRLEDLRAATYAAHGQTLRLTWPDAAGAPRWHVEAHLGDDPGEAPAPPEGARLVAQTHPLLGSGLPPWSVFAWAIDGKAG